MYVLSIYRLSIYVLVFSTQIGDTALQTEHTCQKIDPLLKQSRDYLELTVARQHHQVAGDSYC